MKSPSAVFIKLFTDQSGDTNNFCHSSSRDSCSDNGYICYCDLHNNQLDARRKESTGTLHNAELKAVLVVRMVEKGLSGSLGSSGLADGPTWFLYHLRGTIIFWLWSSVHLL